MLRAPKVQSSWRGGLGTSGENLKFRCLEMLFSALASRTFETDVLQYFCGIFPLF